MKAETHLSSALPALILQQWAFLPGALICDLAWPLAYISNGFRHPGTLPEAWMPLYRAGHSLLLWIPLAILTWCWPWLRPFYAGVLMHLLLDWPTHTGNRPLWPIPGSFDGWGA